VRVMLEEGMAHLALELDLLGVRVGRVPFRQAGLAPECIGSAGIVRCV
jgi:hypothetical protein